MGETDQGPKPPVAATDSTPGRRFLRGLLNHNQSMKICLSDGRVLIGIFLCTDKDSNVILGSCAEYLSVQSADKANNSLTTTDSDSVEPRILGLAMVPGKHILSVHVDETNANANTNSTPVPSNSPTHS